MKVIILPGNDKSNKDWLDNAADAFSDISDDRYKLYLSHWDSGEKIIDFDVELEKLTKNIKDEKEYVIFAKSAGAMLAVYGVYKGEIKPTKCIFVGLPIDWAAKNNFPLKEWLKKFSIPALIIQNSDDPITSFKDLQSELSELDKSNIEVIEIAGNDHKYIDFDLIKEKAKNFIVKEKGENVEINSERRHKGISLK